jgi:hypothetical protein
MHTYTKSKDGAGWQAGYARSGPTSEHVVEPLGPVFQTEAEAASLASYLNGGRWSPGELAEALPEPPEGETPAELEEAARAERRAAEKANRPKGMDYPPEEEAEKPKAKAHAARHKAPVKRAPVKRKR